jgi:phosphoribosyl-AMP cyclohydrolase
MSFPESITDGPLLFDAAGLIPAVIQESETDTVLMIGFLNAEALDATRRTGRVHFWSRSRGKLWRKGETSGHEQIVDEIRVNCERNSLLIRVAQIGAVCHDGYRTCFYRRLTDDNTFEIVMDRSFDPSDVYGAGAANNLTDLTKRLFGAYSYLRNNDLEAVSGTSARLRATSDGVTARLSDELDELAGALDGSHRHQDFAADVLLESTQVLYWATLAAIRAGASWEDVRPDRALETRVEGMTAELLAKLIRAEAGSWRSDDQRPAPLATRLHATLGLVGQAAAIGGITPVVVVSKDLEDLKSRTYLAPYFATQNPA